MSDFTLAELMITAAAEAWRHDPELLATGIGPLPRLATGLARLTMNERLMLTDGESFAVEEPVRLGDSAAERPGFVGWLNYGRIFECLWSGRRHAMVTPVQIDRWAQMNISALGDFAQPKVQMLGCRGFPGNSISHRNSVLVPAHSPRVFVAGEVDVVCSIGFTSRHWPEGTQRRMPDIGRVVTDLCVMDFNGPDHAAQVISLHPGVSLAHVQAQTGFPLLAAPGMGETPVPTAQQLAVIAGLDPRNQRAKVLKGNPPGLRVAA